MKGYPILTTAMVLEYLRERKSVTTDDVIYHFANGITIPSWEINSLRHMARQKMNALRRQGYLAHPDKCTWELL